MVLDWFWILVLDFVLFWVLVLVLDFVMPTFWDLCSIRLVSFTTLLDPLSPFWDPELTFCACSCMVGCKRVKILNPSFGLGFHFDNSTQNQDQRGVAGN